MTITDFGFLLTRSSTNTPYLGFYTTNPYDLTDYSKICMQYYITSSASNVISYGTKTAYTAVCYTPLDKFQVALDISTVTGEQYIHVATAGSASIGIQQIWLEDSGYENIYRL